MIGLPGDKVIDRNQNIYIKELCSKPKDYRPHAVIKNKKTSYQSELS